MMEAALLPYVAACLSGAPAAEETALNAFWQLAVIERSRQSSTGFWGTAQAVQSGWEEARVRVAEIGHLQDNWDGRGACGISATVQMNAQRALDSIRWLFPSMPMPDITPSTGGTISFEWEMDGIEACLEIGNTRYSGYLVTANQVPALFEGQSDAIPAEVLWQIADAISPAQPSAPTISALHWN